MDSNNREAASIQESIDTTQVEVYRTIVQALSAIARQVKANRGAPGVDGMTVGDFVAFAREHWPTIRRALLDGAYSPQPVRRVEIPKPSGKGLDDLDRELERRGHRFTTTSDSDAITWINGELIASTTTSFICCWRESLLADLKRSVSIS